MAIDSGHEFSMKRVGDFVQVKIPAIEFYRVLPVSELWRVSYAVRSLGRHLPVDFTDQIFSRMNQVRKEWQAYRCRREIQEQRMATIGGCAVALSYFGSCFTIGYLIFLWVMS